MKILTIFFIFVGLVCRTSIAAELPSDADSLLKKYQDSVFQVQLIETESNKKSAIGSAFLVSHNKIVTNFHVISSWIHNPDKYKIEIIHKKHGVTAVGLIDFDVVHDLAVLKTDHPFAAPVLALSDNLPNQGDKIFSIGNPHDYGMMVIPGTYNGVTANSFYQRINFTGSINPGMSGGPALNTQGEIVGVNVATAGNQMGFLVPLWHLKTLLTASHEAITKDQLESRIEQQLLASQELFFNKILDSQWPKSKLGRHFVSTDVAQFVRCWGHSNSEKTKALFQASEINCRSQEQIYIDPSFRSGNIEVEYSYYKQSKLNPFQFSNLLEKSFSGVAPGNSARKDDVSNYQCLQDLVADPRGDYNKSLYCVRNYKKYPSLFDVVFLSITASNKHEDALLSHFTLAGVSQNNAQKFLNRFMKVEL